jgi:hypothetical protein
MRDDDDELDRIKAIIARQLGRILECTRFLDLNRSDAEFRKRPPGRAESAEPREAVKEIFYVFDTNVFQALLQPSKWSACSRVFHDRIWPATRSEEIRGFKSLIEAIAAQTTMLATEFVFSESMDGASKQIFISETHHHELIEQIEHFEKELRSSSKVAADLVIDTNRKIKELVALRDMDPKVAMAKLAADPHFYSNFSKGLRLPELKLSQFARIRDDYILSSIGKLVALDTYMEPVDQLGRLFSDEIWSRVRFIEDEFPVPSEQDRQHLEDDERVWHQRLKEEDDLRQDVFRQTKDGTRDDQDKPRSDDSLRADSKTIAYLTWLSRKRVRPHQRIAFVTGDGLILDMYRRWFGRGGEAASFLVRPLAIYGPQYNLRDTGAMLNDHAEVFERTRQALEASTYPLTFTLMEHYFPDHRERYGRAASARARDQFCTAVQGETAHKEVLDKVFGSLTHNLSHNLPVLRRQIATLESMADSLRSVERLAIFVSRELNRKRADPAIERASELLDSIGEAPDGDVDQIVSKWFEKRLNEATERGFRFSLNLAVDQVISLQKRAQTHHSRAMLGLCIKFPYGSDQLPAGEWLERFSNSANRDIGLLSALSKKPALIFTLASWVAFRDHLWTDATRFADFASLAAHYDLDEHEQDEVTVELYNESQYLKAASLRFRMADDRPSEEYDADVWRRDLEGAESALAICIAEHQKRNESVGYLRALVERAAVRLTYCAWAATGDLGKLPTYRREPLELQSIFRSAVRDLGDCAGLYPKVTEEVARSKDIEADVRKQIVERIKNQVQLNPECALILYQKLRCPSTATGNEYLPEMFDVEHQLLNILTVDSFPADDAHPILRAYALSALMRRGDADKRVKAAEALKRISEDEQNLTLDRIMLGLMKQNAGEMLRASEGASPPIGA